MHADSLSIETYNEILWIYILVLVTDRKCSLSNSFKLQPSAERFASSLEQLDEGWRVVLL